MIQDDQSQYTINKTLQRLLQDSDKGSVNITGLSAEEYSVRDVYDNSPATDSTSAAYQHSQLIHIIPVFTTGSSSSLFTIIDLSKQLNSIYNSGTELATKYIACGIGLCIHACPF